MERNPVNGKSLFNALKKSGLSTESRADGRSMQPTFESPVGGKVNFTEPVGYPHQSSSGAFYSMKNKQKEGIIKGVTAPISTSNESVENIVPADFIKKSLFENVAVLNYYGVLKDLLSLYVVNGLNDGVMRTVPSDIVREVRAILKEFEENLF